jgi:hypothetical protein
MISVDPTFAHEFFDMARTQWIRHIPVGQQQWRALVREAALRGKGVEVLELAAYGGYKVVNATWIAGVLTSGGGSAVINGSEGLELPEDLWDAWEERAAIRECDSGLALSIAEQAAWRCLTDAARQ